MIENEHLDVIPVLLLSKIGKKLDFYSKNQLINVFFQKITIYVVYMIICLVLGYRKVSFPHFVRR